MEAAAKTECSDMDAWSVVEMAPSSLDLVSSMISSRNRFSQNHLPQPPTYKRQHPLHNTYTNKTPAIFIEFLSQYICPVLPVGEMSD